MAKRHACKNCGCITEADTCPSCGSNNFATTILGRMVILDPAKSKIAKMTGTEKPGDFAIKMR